jgi:hypothetical protein
MQIESIHRYLRSISLVINTASTKDLGSRLSGIPVSISVSEDFVVLRG